MRIKISVVIPTYNGAKTIEKCLEAAFASKYGNFEVIVVDDCSQDNSVELIKRFPCKLVRLEHRSGASKARNAGAEESSGEIIFFTDSDCLLQPDTLSIIDQTFTSTGPDVITGGTYTLMPYDEKFFSIFQSVFVNYSETGKPDNPDYIAAHAMIISSDQFKKSGGFPEVFLPIIEDVEFSHRLRRSGLRLRINPEIQVQHIFNFSLSGSLRNAFKKTKYWVIYSRGNKDLLTDSGSASFELKFNVVSYCINALLIVLWLILQNSILLYTVSIIMFCNIIFNRNLIKAYYRARGIVFAGMAFFYYSVIYTLPIAAGAVAGGINSIIRKQ